MPTIDRNRRAPRCGCCATLRLEDVDTSLLDSHSNDEHRRNGRGVSYDGRRVRTIAGSIGGVGAKQDAAGGSAGVRRAVLALAGVTWVLMQSRSEPTPTPIVSAPVETQVAAPEPAAEPKPAPETSADATATVAEPGPKPESKPATKPKPTAQPQIRPRPQPIAQPQPQPQPKPEPKPEPKPTGIELPVDVR